MPDSEKDNILTGNLVSSGISALGSVGSSLITAITGYDRQQEMLEYNSPVNQVKRLRKAGINPAFALEQGALDAGNASSPAPPMPQFDINSLAQGVRDGMQLRIQKDLTDSEVRKNDANSYAQEMANKFSLQKNLLDLYNMRASADKDSSQAKLLDQEIELRKKDLESYDRRIGASVGKQEAEARFIDSQTAYQNVLNQFAPVQQKALINQINAHSAELRAAANEHNASALRNKAEALVAQARKEGLDISNDQADALVDVIYNKEIAEAEKAYYDSGQSWKNFEGGKVGSLMPANDVRERYSTPDAGPWNEGRSVPRKYRKR